MMLNFQVATPLSTYGISRTGFVSNQPASDRNFTRAEPFTNVTSSEKKTRGRKRKTAEELAHATTEPASVLPQVEPTQRRRRRKTDESPNGLTRTIMILVLKFSSQVPMPSRNCLMSTFSAFGPLDSSQTHVLEELCGALVAFESSGDAVEAVKSMKNANPFGKTLVSFRLQPKVISAQLNTPPVILHLGRVPKLNKTPTSLDSMKQNLLMMTAMLEKSGGRVSRETKAKLKSEITALLEKVSYIQSLSFISGIFSKTF